VAYRATARGRTSRLPVGMEEYGIEVEPLFDQEAERYDRYRPRYPDAVTDAMLGPEPSGLKVLDAG